jgi:hypothetical protein
MGIVVDTGKPVVSQKLFVNPGSSNAAKSVQRHSTADKNKRVHSFQVATNTPVTNTQIPVLYIGGTTLEYLMGIRISLPFFGSGFNICIGECWLSINLPNDLHR